MPTLGLIGCAHCHTPWILKELTKRSDVVIKSAFDHDHARAEASAKQCGAKVVATQEEIWNDPAIDGVFILSETDRHEADVLAAARHKKPIFVEKPLGLGARDAIVMARAIEEAKLLFMTGYRTRSEGLFIFLRDQIRRGAFGKLTRIRYITCHGALLAAGAGFEPEHQWMLDAAQAGGGGFLDLGTHAMDSLMWLVGERVVSATSAMNAAVSVNGTFKGGSGDGHPDNFCEEYGEGLVRFEGGAIGSLAAAWVDVEQPVRCVISGTEGHAYVLNNRLYLKSKNVPGADGKEVWTDLPKDRPLVFDVFVDTLRDKLENDYVSAFEAANVCTVHDAMRAGAKAGTWVEPRWLA